MMYNIQLNFSSVMRVFSRLYTHTFDLWKVQVGLVLEHQRCHQITRGLGSLASQLAIGQRSPIVEVARTL